MRGCSVVSHDLSGMLDPREDIRDRLESNLSVVTMCRLPRSLTVAQRRRAGMVKQWSMDETQTWFYSRSPSLDRPPTSAASDQVDSNGGLNGSSRGHYRGHNKLSADGKRKFFQRRSTSSAPNSSTESSLENGAAPTPITTPVASNSASIFSKARNSSRLSTSTSFSDSAVSKALEEALKASALLGWEPTSSNFLEEDETLEDPDTTNNCCSSTSSTSARHQKLPPRTKSVDVYHGMLYSSGGMLSKSSPSTANSSPKISRGKFSIGSLGGLVRSRDGSRLSPNTQTYISLPSPNIQSAKNDPMHEPSINQARTPDDPEDPGTGPDSTQLVRRGALVPPKIDDPSEPVTDPGGSAHNGQHHHHTFRRSESHDNNPSESESCSSLSNLSSNRTFPRRSSVVVIPPMQVCPGDLLVYSKALTHRGNFPELDGSTQSLANEVAESSSSTSASTSARKAKTPWSLLKLFERDKKSKGNDASNSVAHTIGLEEVLSSLSSSEFMDEQLIRLCGLTWCDFVDLVDIERSGGSGLAWLSQSSPSKFQQLKQAQQIYQQQQQQQLLQSPRSRPRPPIQKGASIDTTQTTLASSEEDTEVGDSLTSPVSNFKPVITRVRRSRLKRAQSERAPSYGAASPSPATSPGRLSQQQQKQPLNEAEAENSPVSPEGSVEVPVDLQQPTLKSPARGPRLNRGRPIRGNLVHSMTFTAKDVDPTSRFLTGRESLSRNETKRREAVWDLFQSETAFLLDHLMVLKHVYMEPLKKAQVEGFLMFAEPEVLFGNLDELCCVTHSFCKEFLQGLLTHLDGDGDLNVTELMRRLFEKGSKARMLSQAYHRYALNYINALNYLESLRRQNDFCDFEKWCNKDVRCKKLQLTDLLVSPVHHIMKIPLVIREIEARTDDIEEKVVITKIHEMKEHSLRELDDKMKWLKNFDRLLEIQRNIVWPSVLEMDPKQYYPEFLKAALSKQPCERLIVSPRRQILIEGQLLMFEAGKPTEMFIILFDDLLLITRKKKALSKKKSSLGENWPAPGVRMHSTMSSDVSMKYVVHKQPLSLDRFFIHEVSTSEAALAKLDNAFILICLNRFQQIISVLTFQADSEQLKNNWIQKLREAQEMWKRTLQTTVFKDSHSCTMNNNNSIDSTECQYPNSGGSPPNRSTSSVVPNFL